MTCIHIEHLLKSCCTRSPFELQTPSETSAYLLASSSIYLGGIEYSSFLQHKALLDAEEGRELGCRQTGSRSTVLFRSSQIFKPSSVGQAMAEASQSSSVSSHFHRLDPPLSCRLAGEEQMDPGQLMPFVAKRQPQLPQRLSIELPHEPETWENLRAPPKVSICGDTSEAQDVLLRAWSPAQVQSSGQNRSATLLRF